MHNVRAPSGWAPAASSHFWVQRKPARCSPSQNPDPAAQQPIDDAHAARERRTVFFCGALLAGVAVGTVVGTAIAGPLGVLLGGTIGAVAGGFGGMAVGARTAP